MKGEARNAPNSTSLHRCRLESGGISSQSSVICVIPTHPLAQRSNLLFPNWKGRGSKKKQPIAAWVLGTAAILALSSPAFATPLTLAEAVAGIGPQSTNNPCIIAATNCQQPAGFAFTDFTQKGSVSAYNIMRLAQRTLSDSSPRLLEAVVLTLQSM